MKIYAVLPLMQEQLINNHCFGDCGKILVAGLDLGDCGPAFPCKEELCPHLNKQMDEPIGEDSEGNQVYLRKLK